jgi:murein DD-endopeptidase MepM/ murein hydrolase activator NlpD
MPLLTLNNPVSAPVSRGFGLIPCACTGYRRTLHDGLDYLCDPLTPVKSAAAGIVAYVGFRGSRGFCVVINHGYGCLTSYCHLDRAYVSRQQRVEQGRVIALSGRSGNCIKPHLHFGVKIKDKLVDPAQAISLGVDQTEGTLNKTTLTVNILEYGLLAGVWIAYEMFSGR